MTIFQFHLMQLKITLWELVNKGFSLSWERCFYLMQMKIDVSFLCLSENGCLIKIQDRAAKSGNSQRFSVKIIVFILVSREHKPVLHHFIQEKEHYFCSYFCINS